MKKILAAVLLLSSFAAGQQKHVAITIDDLPSVGVRSADIGGQRTLTKKLLAALVRHGVPAIGFVNGSKLVTDGTADSRKAELLQQWLDAGMELGNHTYAHKDYNAVSYAEFTEDVVAGEACLTDMLAKRGSSLRYFRHPYLHRGDSRGKADSLALFLKARGCEEAPVTIDNGEWIYAAAYAKAFTARDTVHMERLGAEYVSYMEKKLEYYERQSVALFGRVIAQTLLIHANLLNADHFDALASMFERNGYAFVPLERALADSAYRTPDTFYRKGGISWLDRWALTQGMTREFFAGEPAVPAHILKLANVSGE